MHLLSLRTLRYGFTPLSLGCQCCTTCVGHVKSWCIGALGSIPPLKRPALPTLLTATIVSQYFDKTRLPQYCPNYCTTAANILLISSFRSLPYSHSVCHCVAAQFHDIGVRQGVAQYDNVTVKFHDAVVGVLPAGSCISVSPQVRVCACLCERARFDKRHIFRRRVLR